MTGYKYPLTIENGTLVLTQGCDLTEGAIISSVMTVLGERVYRPDYGRAVHPFDGSIPETLRSLRQAIAIGTSDRKGLIFELTGSIKDSGLLNVQVVYTCDNETRIFTVDIGAYSA